MKILLIFNIKKSTFNILIIKLIYYNLTLFKNLLNIKKFILV